MSLVRRTLLLTALTVVVMSLTAVVALNETHRSQQALGEVAITSAATRHAIERSMEHVRELELQVLHVAESAGYAQFVPLAMRQAAHEVSEARTALSLLERELSSVAGQPAEVSAGGAPRPGQADGETVPSLPALHGYVGELRSAFTTLGDPATTASGRQDARVAAIAALEQLKARLVQAEHRLGEQTERAILREEEHESNARTSLITVFALTAALALLLSYLAAARIAHPLRRAAEIAVALGGDDGGARGIEAGKNEARTLHDALQQLERKLEEGNRARAALAETLGSVVAGVAHVDPCGRLKGVTPEFAAVLGREPADLEGVPLADVNAADQRDRLATLLSGLNLNGRANAEVAVVDDRGGRREIEMWLRAGSDGDSSAVCCVRDVSERKTQEREVEEARRRFQLVSRYSPGLMYAGNSRTRRLYFITEQVRSMTGYSPEEALASEAFLNTLIHPDDRGRLAVFSKSDKAHDAMEYRIITRDGEVRWVRDEFYRVEDSVEDIYGCVVDVTEQVESQQALRESRSHLAHASRLASLGYWERNLHTGELLWSRQVHEIFGVSPESFDGTFEAFLACVHPDDRQAIGERTGLAMDNGDVLDFTHRIVKPDGMVRHVREWAEVIGDASGKPAVLRGTVQDVTERVRQSEAQTALIERLRDSEAALEGAQRIARMGSWRLDGSARRFRYSDAACPVLGKVGGSSEGVSAFLARVDEDDREAVRAALEHGIARRECIDFEFRLRGPDGEQRFVHLRGEVDDEHPDGSLHGTVQDVTERRLIENALREQTELNDAMIDALPGIFMIFDAEGRAVRWNRNALEIFAATPQQMRDWTIADLTGPEDVPRIRRAVERAVQGETVTVEGVARRPDGGQMNFLGTFRAMDVRGEVQVLGFASDITELTAYRENLQALVEQRTRDLTQVFELSPDGFVSLDGEDRVTYVNSQFAEMTGIPAEEATGLDAETLRARVAALTGSGADAPGPWRDEEIDVALVRPRPRIVRCVTRTERDAEDRVLGRLLCLRDITHETEVSRMKSDFLTTAAHELRTPLASVYGYAELLAEGEHDEQARVDMVETIRTQSRELNHLVGELLDLARIESRAGRDFRIVRGDLRETVSSVVEHWAVPEGREPPDLVVPMEVPPTDFDEAKIAQALRNLLSNAYRYSAGGPVEVRMHAEYGEGARGASRIGLSVRDHGIGMDHDDQQRVFDRFWRADKSGNVPGTGLGMSLVREIMEVHCGSIDVASQKGEGTTVTLWIPVATSARAVA